MTRVKPWSFSQNKLTINDYSSLDEVPDFLVNKITTIVVNCTINEDQFRSIVGKFTKATEINIPENSHDFTVNGDYGHLSVKYKEIETNPMQQCNIGDFDVTIDRCTKTAILEKYTGQSPEVIIPDSISYEDTEYTVLRINGDVFAKCGFVKTVHFESFPSSIPEVKKYGPVEVREITVRFGDTVAVFSNFDFVSSNHSLRNLVLSPMVIDTEFRNCDSLRKIIIGKDTILKGGAFAGCKNLEYADLGKWIEELPNCLFKDCSSLKTVQIPEAVKTISEGAFENCTLLETVHLPDGIEVIGNNAFYGCESLSSIDLPNKITTIGDYSFGHCTALTSVKLPESMTHLGKGSFSDCTSLSDIEIGKNITSIGDRTFSSCNRIEEITIPDGVESIGESAFRGCINLLMIRLGKNLSFIGKDAFYGCSSLYEIINDSSIDLWGDKIEVGLINSHAASIHSSEKPRDVIKVNINEDDTVYLKIKSGNVCNLISYRSLSAEISIPDFFAYNGEKLQVRWVKPGSFRKCLHLKKITFNGDGYWFASRILGVKGVEEIDINGSVKFAVSSSFYPMTFPRTIRVNGEEAKLKPVELSGIKYWARPILAGGKIVDILVGRRVERKMTWKEFMSLRKE